MDETETILESAVDGTKVEHLSHHTTAVHCGIEVVERVPIVEAADERLVERHVVVLLRSEMIASMTLPGLITEHGLTAVKIRDECKFAYQLHGHSPVEVILRGGIIQVDILLFTVVNLRHIRQRGSRYQVWLATNQRYAGHDQCRDESGEGSFLSPVLQTRPAEHIEITGTEHVPRVHVATDGVQEVIVDEHLVPRGNEVDVDIVSVGQVAVHSKETGERAVGGVVEGDGVEAVVGLVPKEVLALVGGQVGGDVEATGKLSRSPASATTDASQII